ncbi:hypothetical protein HYQ46_003356 [Verticillium longisporum]|nr:hypothetical protein HYQ46_003356 [Verticillium longisporum]
MNTQTKVSSHLNAAMLPHRHCRRKHPPDLKSRSLCFVRSTAKGSQAQLPRKEPNQEVAAGEGKKERERQIEEAWQWTKTSRFPCRAVRG